MYTVSIMCAVSHWAPLIGLNVRYQKKMLNKSLIWKHKLVLVLS